MATNKTPPALVHQSAAAGSRGTYAKGIAHSDLARLKRDIQNLALAQGFQQLGVADVDLQTSSERLQHWLASSYHGEMHYMQQHGEMRWRPELLVPGTIRALSVRMDYLPEPHSAMWQQLERHDAGYVSRYALGRDYHKLIRQRLQRLADSVAALIGPFGYRAFVDSGPVLEKPLAEKAGLGWIGKHTNLIHRKAGSWFFLGELLVDLPLPIDRIESSRCGTCSRCIPACPTGAIVAPYQLDARRCISYLTIELKGAVPIELRPLIGNRIYGCDDCQLVCPWNKFARISAEPAFQARHGLDSGNLLALFQWTEAEFLTRTEGSAIRRIGYERWQRNIAVALGNAPATHAIQDVLRSQLLHPNLMVREHVSWALRTQIEKSKLKVKL